MRITVTKGPRVTFNEEEESGGTHFAVALCNEIRERKNPGVRKAFYFVLRNTRGIGGPSVNLQLPVGLNYTRARYQSFSLSINKVAAHAAPHSASRAVEYYTLVTLNVGEVIHF